MNLAALTRFRYFRLRRVLMRNEAKLNLGPPLGQERQSAPELYNPKRDLDGREAAALLRAQAIKARKEATMWRAI